MHFKCLASYQQSVKSKQAAEPTRNHPENLTMKQFSCPLCKSLSNILLPIHFESIIEKTSLILPEYDFQANVTQVIKNGTNMRLNTYKSVSRELKKIGENQIQATLPGAFPETQSNRVNCDQLLKLYHIGYVIPITLTYVAGEAYSDIDGSISPRNINVSLNLLSTTIRSIEIQYRGIQGPSITSCVSNQNLDLLRVLSSVHGMYNMMTFHEPVEVRENEIRRAANVLLYDQDVFPTFEKPVNSIFTLDLFEVLMTWIYFICPAYQMSEVAKRDIIHTLYILSIFQSILCIVEAFSFGKSPSWYSDDDSFTLLRSCSIQVDENDSECYKRLIKNIIQEMKYYDLDDNDITLFLALIPMKFVQKFVRVNANIFLRKCSLLLYAHSGIRVDDGLTSGNELNDSITNMNLPTISQALHLLDQSFTHQKNHFTSLMKDGLNKIVMQHKASESSISLLIQLQTPIIYELLTLPLRIDSLLLNSLDKICKTCLTAPTNSAWCLLCGAFLCCQSFCCMNGDSGEVNMHRKSYKAFKETID